MLVVRYRHFPDRSYAKELIAKRGMNPIILNDLPDYGMIAFDNGAPVAMGFIRAIEGPYAMLDSFITDPDAPSEIRDRALHHIIRKLTKIAHENGVEKILALTLHDSLVSRCVGLGYSHLMSMKLLIKGT